MESQKANKFKRISHHLKSNQIDEKLELLSEIPVNNTSSLYVIEPPETIVTGENVFAPLNLNQDDPAESGRDTSGLFGQDGSILTVEPPGDTSYVLGPMISMWYAWGNFTTIGYVRESDRRMVNLASITGTIQNWNGSSNFTSYGQLTLAQAQWYKQQVTEGNVQDYRAFYPGPPSNPADQWGRYLGLLVNLPKELQQQIEYLKRALMGGWNPGDIPPWLLANPLVLLFGMLNKELKAMKNVNQIDGMLKKYLGKDYGMGEWSKSKEGLKAPVLQNNKPVIGADGKPLFVSASGVNDKGKFTGHGSGQQTTGNNVRNIVNYVKNTSGSSSGSSKGGGSGDGGLIQPIEPFQGSDYDKYADPDYWENYYKNKQSGIDGASAPSSQGNQVAQLSDKQERAIDKMLLKGLINGDYGSGPAIDKQIRNLEIKLYGIPIKGVSKPSQPSTQVASYQPQGKLISESRKSIIKNIKKPVVLPEEKKEKIKHRPRVAGINYDPRTINSDLMKKAEVPTSFKQPEERLWGKYEKDKNARWSQERKNEILDHLGASNHAWEWLTETSRKKGVDSSYSHFDTEDIKTEKSKCKVVRREQLNSDYLLFLVDENGTKETILQSDLSIKIADKFDKKLFGNYLNEQETLQADKDPLFSKVKNKLKPVLDYQDKPSKLGYPDQPPPEMVNGWHPEYGTDKKFYNKLDPQSADAMPATGNPEIDAKVRRSKTLKRVLGKKA